MPSTRRQRWLLAVIAAALLTAGCVPHAAQPPAPPSEDLVFVIPAGTAAAAMRGEPAFQYPSEIHLAPGQAIVIRNDDQAMHYFFSAPIAPGQTYQRAFEHPGRYGHTSTLSCSLSQQTSVSVVVGDGVARWGEGGS
jgi:hypothetical protein